MNSGHELSLAFIKKNAGSAGRVLASLSPDNAAEYLANVPASLAAKALAGINPHSAALIVQQMSIEAASSVIESLGFTRSAGLVRQIDPPMRKPILVLLPRSMQRNFELALNFPMGMVGAHMSTAVILMGADDAAGEALDIVRRSQDENLNAVFVVDQQHQLVGAVSISNLLRFDSQTPLSEMLDDSCVSLSAHANLENVSSLDIWNDYSQLPVVNRRSQVIGVLERRVLNPEVSKFAEDESAVAPGLIQSLAEALTVSVAGLAGLLAPRSNNLNTPGDDHVL